MSFLFAIPSHHLFYGNVCNENKYTGMATFKNISNYICQDRQALRESVCFVIQESEFESAKGQGIFNKLVRCLLRSWQSKMCNLKFLINIFLFFYICKLLSLHLLDQIQSGLYTPPSFWRGNKTRINWFLSTCRWSEYSSTHPTQTTHTNSRVALDIDPHPGESQLQVSPGQDKKRHTKVGEASTIER